MLGTLRTTAVVLVLIAASPVPGARADVLHVLNSAGLLRSIDPATGEVLRRTQLQAPGKVVTGARGLGAVPGGGSAYGLLHLGDTCTLDPTRTVFVGGDYPGCGGVSGEACDQAYVVSWDGQPKSCTRFGSDCELCGSCPNTCAPPPPCLGSARTQWAGFGVGACRQFDGDVAGCANAYYSDETGTFACFESAGECLACDLAAQVAGACTYECQPERPCADPARDVFVGVYNCWLLGSDVCGRAFQSDYRSQPGACVVASDGQCAGCDAGSEAGGFCTNTCSVPPPCDGDPARAAVPLCYVHEGDAAACAQAYTTDDAGGAVTCFVTTSGGCVPCDDLAERLGTCANACAPAVCAGDPARTTLLEPPADCHVLDGDPGGCAAAYFVGRCGVSSCHYDAAAGACRRCTLEDPERCENACGAFESLYGGRPYALATVDLATGEVAVVGSPVDSLIQPVPDTTGAVYALGYQNTCVGEGLFRLDGVDLRPALVAPLSGGGGGPLALHPETGEIYRLALDGLFATDPMTGVTNQIPTDAPVWLVPAAMTWAPACGAFLVADAFDGLWRLDPVAGTLTKTALHLEGECDEGDCARGLVMDGATVCPPITFSTTTTTTTSTSTSSSTSSTTLPSELITGRRLTLIDDAAKPRRRRLHVRSSDATISLGGGNGSADDPVLHGGRLVVRAASGSIGATYALDGEWRYLGKTGRDKGYEWRGTGPIRSVVLRPGALEIRGKGEALEQSLLTDPGAVRVMLRLGGRRWCLEFGGTTDARTTRKLAAHDAPPPTVCAPGGG